VTNPLFGTAINGLQGRVLEFASPHELLRCYLYWGGDVYDVAARIFLRRGGPSRQPAFFILFPHA
jgi:hypothetical protein